MTKRDLWFMALGAVGLVVVKYGLVGTCQWQTFQPDQTAGSSFFYPLFGLIHPSTCDQVSTVIDYSGSTT